MSQSRAGAAVGSEGILDVQNVDVQTGADSRLKPRPQRKQRETGRREAGTDPRGRRTVLLIWANPGDFCGQEATFDDGGCVRIVSVRPDIKTVTA